jgi:two-component system response regulator HydG
MSVFLVEIILKGLRRPGSGEAIPSLPSRETLVHLRERLAVDELMVICGSDRWALFGVGAVSPEVERQVLSFLGSYFELSADTVTSRSSTRYGEEALRYLLSLALGLSGDFPGDRRGMEFLQRGYSTSFDAGLTGPVTHKVYQRALWLGEKVRLETDILSGATSSGEVIVELAQKIFGDLRTRRLLVLGNPQDSELVSTLSQSGVGGIYVVTPSRANGSTLAGRLSGTAVSGATSLSDVPTVDIILVSEEEYTPWFGREAVNDYLSQRHRGALMVVDFTPKRSLSKGLKGLYNVHIYEADDLRRVVEVNVRERQKEVPRVQAIIDEEVAALTKWLNSEERYHFGEIVGRSQEMQKVMELIARVSQTDITVLIDGESGTGKELVAKAIHQHSRRVRRPFVVVNCAALPDTLLESELFGHVRGSFTGAISDKKGLFEEAQGGTIFLDEIGETSQATQVKLLRFLQEGEIKRVGSNTTLRVDVRLIAATNRDLQAMVDAGEFRQDLFYRLNVIQITLPPLRERPDDILPLAEFFVRKYAARMRKNPPMLSQEAIQLLTAYDWPGNVRELENAIERAVTLCLGDRILPHDLPEALHGARPSLLKRALSEQMTLRELEKYYIIETLERNNWNYELVTKILGIGRTTLWRKLKEYNLRPRSG